MAAGETNHLPPRDRLQASEKAWGAMAHKLKHIAQNRRRHA